MAVFLRELNNILLKLTTRYKTTKCFIVGDFNINLLRIASGSLPLDYVTTMFSYGYMPLIERPARVTDQSATLIDHIWMNDCSVVRDRGIIRSSKTDYFPVFASIYKESAIILDEKVVYLKRIFNRLTEKKFTVEISKINWYSVAFESNDNMEDIYNSFTGVISSKFNECFPLIEKKKKKIRRR